MLLHAQKHMVYTLTICIAHCVDALGLCRHLIDISEKLGFVHAQMWFTTKRIVGNAGPNHRNGWTGLLYGMPSFSLHDTYSTNKTRQIAST